MKTWMTTIVGQRMRTILDNAGLETDHFLDLLQKCHGQISGSICLEAMLGADVFRAGDIDVFVEFGGYFKQTYFSDLHRYLFHWRTGVVSDPKNAWTDAERWQHRLRVRKSQTDPHMFAERTTPVKLNYGGDSIMLLKEKFRIVHIWDYCEPGSRNVQVVSIRILKDFGTIERYIRKRFDIRMASSTFDGKFVGRHILDVYRRQILFTDDYHFRAKFFCEYEKILHQQRLRKYTRRGFQLAGSPVQTVCTQTSAGLKNFQKLTANNSEREKSHSL